MARIRQLKQSRESWQPRTKEDYQRFLGKLYTIIDTNQIVERKRVIEKLSRMYVDNFLFIPTTYYKDRRFVC